MVFILSLACHFALWSQPFFVLSQFSIFPPQVDYSFCPNTMHIPEQSSRRVEPKSEGGPKSARRKRRDSHSSPQFEFITSVGQLALGSKDAESKQIVRVHAMRSFLRRRQENSIDDRLESNVSRTAKPQAPSAGKFKLDSWSRKSSKRKSKEQTTDDEQLISSKWHERALIVPVDMGPFEILNIPLTPQVRRLLHHCTFEISIIKLLNNLPDCEANLSSHRSP